MSIESQNNIRPYRQNTRAGKLNASAPVEGGQASQRPFQPTNSGGPNPFRLPNTGLGLKLTQFNAQLNQIQSQLQTQNQLQQQNILLMQQQAQNPFAFLAQSFVGQVALSLFGNLKRFMLGGREQSEDEEEALDKEMFNQVHSPKLFSTQRIGKAEGTTTTGSSK